MKTPLLLTEGAGSIAQQANDARFRGRYGHPWVDRYDADRIFCCHVDPNNQEDTETELPRYITHQHGMPRKSAGCIEIIREGTPARCFKDGDWSRYTAHILFTSRDGFHRAWQIARRLRSARKGHPVFVSQEKIAGLRLNLTDLMPVEVLKQSNPAQS